MASSSAAEMLQSPTPPPPSQQAPQQPSQSLKRRPDDQLESEQRLAKRLNSLNLDQSGRLRISAPTTLSAKTASQPATTAQPPHPPPRTAGSTNDGMQVEDTPHRVYISDLDEELASIEDDEDKLKLTFLPDIEAQLNRIPQHVFGGPDSGLNEQSKKGNELVLYSVPNSLSVPEDRDGVRKAILESRARAREEQGQSYSDGPASGVEHGGLSGYQSLEPGRHDANTHYAQFDGQDFDEDAMDIG